MAKHTVVIGKNTEIEVLVDNWVPENMIIFVAKPGLIVCNVDGESEFISNEEAVKIHKRAVEAVMKERPWEKTDVV